MATNLEAISNWPKVKQLGRHLPVLGGLIGLPILCAGAVSAAHHVTSALMGSGGDVTVALNRTMHTATTAWITAGVWIDQAAAIVFGS